jgi:hypothetical protein
MLSQKECRKIMGPTCTLSDSELNLLLEAHYAFAHIALETYPKLRSEKVLPNQQQKVTFESMLKLLSEAEQEEAIERVGIMEFQGGLSCKEAEKEVMNEHFKRHNKRN